MYNESLLLNTTTIFDNYHAINHVTSIPYLFSIIILLSLWIIFFVVGLNVLNFIRSLTFSSFLTAIFTAFLWAAGEISEKYIIIPFLMFLIGLFFIIFGDD